MADEFSSSQWDEIYEASDPYLKYELTDKGRDQIQIVKDSDPEAFRKKLVDTSNPAQMAFFTFLMGLDRGFSISKIYNLLKKQGISEEPIRHGLLSLIQNEYIAQAWEDDPISTGDHPWPERL